MGECNWESAVGIVGFGLTDACGIDRYLELLKDRKVKGYLGEEKNYWKSGEGKSS